jgi:EpsI family protein
MDKPTIPHTSPLLSRRKVVLGIGLTGLAAFAQARQPSPNRPALERGELADMMPDQIGQWKFRTQSGLVLPPSDALSDRLYDNLVTRTYENPQGQMAMFLMAYNNTQDGVLQIHRPETCYPAGGYLLSETQSRQISLTPNEQLPVQAFSADSRDRDEVVMYWTRVGNEFPGRWTEQRLSVAKANLNGVIPDGMLARVSTLGNDMEGNLPVLESFVSDLYTLAPAHLRALLFGGPLPA